MSLPEELGREMRVRSQRLSPGWLKYPRSPFSNASSGALAPGGFAFRGSFWIWLDFRLCWNTAVVAISVIVQKVWLA